MSGVRVSSAAVQAAAAFSAARVAEFEERVSAVERLVSSTIGEEWVGAGAEAFADDFAVWIAGAREVHEALGRITSLLGSASQTYESTEQAVTHSAESSTVVTEGLVA